MFENKLSIFIKSLVYFEQISVLFIVKTTKDLHLSVCTDTELSFFFRQNNWEQCGGKEALSQSTSDVTVTPAVRFIDGPPWAVISLVFSRSWKCRLLLQGVQSYRQNIYRQNFLTAFHSFEFGTHQSRC